MKNLLVFCIGFTVMFSNAFGQLSPNGNSGSTTTVYTNGTPNDPIYIWCNEGLVSATGSLTAVPTSGTAPWTFEWYYHNESNASWTPYFSDAGASSTISNLPSDGYRVEIYDNGGNLVDCYIAWVWNMNTDLTASNAPTACDATNLAGTVNVTNFTYYNPPPPESLINASTDITVCFSATHTFVSDLGYFLVGPASCGSPTISLSPNPGAVGLYSICNSGNDVNNLCFTTTSASIFDVCSSSTPVTGTYGGYLTSSGNQIIDWTSLFGCNAAQGGWQVQIYDCIGSDVGALTHASITFSNLTSVCGSPTTITYDSGSINSTINDNSCSAGTASLFAVPPSTNLTTPITINPTVNYIWSSSQPTTIPNPTTSLTNSVAGIPTGVTQFYLDVDVTYGGTTCSYIDSTAFTQTCCTAIVDAGSDVNYCTGSSSQIGTPTVAGMDYSWSPATDLSSATDAQPTVSAVNGGTSPINITYTLTVTNTVDGGCTATDDVVVTVNPTPTVNAGSYGPVCPEAGLVALAGTPSGGTFSGTGVTGSNFDPSVGTQTITYNYTDGNGCSNSATTNIVVNPAAVVNGGSDQSVCEGGSVTLSGSGVVSYSWDNGIPNGVSFTPPVGITTYTVTGTDANGCQDTDQVDVTVWALPNVNAGSDQSVCDGVQVTLSGSGAQTYSWDNGVSNGVAFTQGVGTTTYTVTGTDANGCVNTDQVNVTVNANPTVNAGSYGPVCPEAGLVALAGTPSGGTFSGTGVTGSNFDPGVGTQTITYNYTDGNGCSNSATTNIVVNPAAVVNGGSDQSVCEGGSVTLSGSGVVSYSWDNGIPNGVSFTPPVGITTYTVTGTDANGCQDTDQVDVTVWALPNVNAGSDQSVCDGVQVTLSGSGAQTYSWDNGVSNGVAFTQGVGTTTYTVTGTDANGCVNTDQVNVTVNANPTVNAGTYTAVCPESGTVALAGIPVGGTFSGIGVTGSNFDPSVGTQTITYTYTDGNGCSNSATSQVMVYPAAVINAGSDQQICEGESATLSASGGVNYVWDNGVTDGQSFTPGVGVITYTVVGTDANGCIGTDQVDIDVLAQPIADATSDVTSGEITLGVTFYNNSVNGTNYSWNFGNGYVSTSPNPDDQVMTYSEPGTYYVILTATNGMCISQDTVVIIALPHPPPIVKIPNVFTPNNDGDNDIYFFEMEHVESLDLTILNRWGNVMFEESGANPVWDGKSKSGADAVEGTYYYKYKLTGINGDVLEGHGFLELLR